MKFIFGTTKHIWKLIEITINNGLINITLKSCDKSGKTLLKAEKIFMSAFGVNFSLIKIKNTCRVVNGVHSTKYPE